MGRGSRSRSWTAALLGAALLCADVYYQRPVHADTQSIADVDFFYGALAPYGTWVEHSSYGRVWYPGGVPAGWRPYTDGHWDYTYEYGWVWVSDWEWGWAPFHYGRWVWDEWYGWVWVPGSVWAPAWVVWRYGGGYAAWAPMPPTVVWNPGYGLVTDRFDYERDLPRDCWVGVPERHLRNRHIHRYLIEPRHNDRFLRTAKSFVNIGMAGNGVVNYGVPVKRIEKVSGSKVQPIHVHEVERMEDRSREFHKGALAVFRPNFRTSGEEELRRAEALAERARRKNDIGVRGHGGESGVLLDEQLRRIPGRLQKAGLPGVDHGSREAPLPDKRGGHMPLPPDLNPVGERGKPYRDGGMHEGSGRPENHLQTEIFAPGDEVPGVSNNGAGRQGQQHRPREIEWQQLQQKVELQRRQAEQAEQTRQEGVWRQQQEQYRRLDVQRQEQMEMQRGQAERSEQARREQLWRQQEMESQRRRMEQAENASREALRRQQMLEQQERARYQQLQQREQEQEHIRRQQQMQIQQQQEMHRQQMDMQRRQSEAFRQRQSDAGQSFSGHAQPPGQQYERRRHGAD